jgi:hypothetical protein
MEAETSHALSFKTWCTLFRSLPPPVDTHSLSSHMHQCYSMGYYLAPAEAEHAARMIDKYAQASLHSVGGDLAPTQSFVYHPQGRQWCHHLRRVREGRDSLEIGVQYHSVLCRSLKDGCGVCMRVVVEDGQQV